MRFMNPRRSLIAGLLTALVSSLLLIAAPAGAAAAMPVILLKGGAAVVGYTYTATPTTRAYPSGSSPRYQWYRGDKQASDYSFQAIPGATGQRYTVKDADHMHTLQVRVTAVRNGSVVGQTVSSPSNFVLLRMTPPVLTGVSTVGQTITAHVGAWAKEWNVKYYWRRTGVNIAGQNGLTYRTRPADAGKEISILALGTYHYADGVVPIDRFASRMRINWGTKAILKGASPAKGRLGITAIAYAAGAKQSTVRGRLAIYDGSRMIKRTWLRGGRKVIRFSHLRSGTHSIKMVFVSNPFFAGSRTVRTFKVR